MKHHWLNHLAANNRKIWDLYVLDASVMSMLLFRFQKAAGTVCKTIHTYKRYITVDKTAAK